jgi:hypothetical protein
VSLSSDRIPVELDSRVTWLPRGGRTLQTAEAQGGQIHANTKYTCGNGAGGGGHDEHSNHLIGPPKCPTVSDGVKSARMVADWPRIVLRVHNADNTNWGTNF